MLTYLLGVTVHKEILPPWQRHGKGKSDTRSSEITATSARKSKQSRKSVTQGKRGFMPQGPAMRVDEDGRGWLKIQ